VTVCIVGSGLLVYGYLGVVAHALPAGEYGQFGAYWSVALIIGFGFFLPIELELARLLPSRPPAAPLPPGTLGTTAGMTALSLLAVLVGLPLLLPAVGGVGVALPLVALAFVFGGQFLLRGLLLGSGRLPLHGTLLLVDGALRAGAATTVALVLPGAGPAAFAWTLVAAVALAHLPVLLLIGRARRRRTGPARAIVPRSGQDSSAWEFPAAVAPLLVANLCAQVLLNGAPVLVSALATAGQATDVDRFVATFTLVRLPLFVAVPLQSALVPSLTRLSTTGSPAALRTWVLGLTAAIAGLAVVGGLLGLTVGPLLVAVLFGGRYALTAPLTALLAAGSGLHVGLLVVSQALLAAALHRRVAVVWITGLAAGGLIFAIVPDLVLRAVLAFALGSGAALLLGLVLLLRRHTRPADAPGAAVPSPPEGRLRRARR
jgi:O-antigen/teichoic acid export membrane protein